MKHLLILVLLQIGVSALFGQTDSIRVYDADKSNLALFVNNHIVSPFSSTVLYTVKGNVVFEGNSESKDDIVYLVEAKDIINSKRSRILAGIGDSLIMTVKKGRVYLGNSGETNDASLMGYLEGGDNIIQFKDYKNRLLGYTDSKQLNPAQTFMAFKFLSNKYSLADLTQARIDSAKQNGLSGDIIGGVRARWSSGPFSEWVWDGQILRPKHVPDIYFEWVFDGEIIKPRWQHHIFEEWTWDGESLKPLWAQSPENEYIWNGRLLKPYWPSGNRMEFVIEDGMASPYLGSPRGEEWYIYGNIPLPLVSIVILGIAFR